MLVLVSRGNVDAVWNTQQARLSEQESEMVGLFGLLVSVTYMYDLPILHNLPRVALVGT